LNPSSELPGSGKSLLRRLDLILRQLDTHARKRLGQNFMVDDSALEFIRSAAAAIPASGILEIGPGTGFLTERLAESGLPLIAVDTDRRFCSMLKKRFEPMKHVRIVEADILRWDPAGALNPGTLAVGNVPYNITSPILEWLMDRRDLWAGVILTVQKEFAERLIAPAGTRECGPISIWMQLHADIRILRVISRGAFAPPPKVDSAVIQIDFLKTPRYEPGTGEILERVMRSAFQMRRKMISHAVKDLVGSAEKAQRVFVSAGVSSDQRPETLTLAQWVALGRAVHESDFLRETG
jgi:16S rRNA (adenine1518-N6/adenine1519-N6)-dimethyltransferase